jgi:hypothetical protein
MVGKYCIITVDPGRGSQGGQGTCLKNRPCQFDSDPRHPLLHSVFLHGYTDTMIVKKKDGYYVLSEKTKRNLGGPYKTKEEAKKRLQQVEYFKHLKK